ncbi:MAG: hypothetical protein DWH99_06395 [Planctomycetota bacterium]|nr:MAG: hypothetical protein DWH99_06395 [Planctomycetota bacterium]
MLLANGAWPWAKSAGLPSRFQCADFRVSIRLVRCKILIAPSHSRGTLAALSSHSRGQLLKKKGIHPRSDLEKRHAIRVHKAPLR